MTDLRLLSPRAAADLLGVSRATLKRLTESGALPHLEMESGAVRYQLVALEAHARRMGELAAERAS